MQTRRDKVIVMHVDCRQRFTSPCAVTQSRPSPSPACYLLACLRSSPISSRCGPEFVRRRPKNGCLHAVANVCDGQSDSANPATV